MRRISGTRRCELSIKGERGKLRKFLRVEVVAGEGAGVGL